MAAEQKLLNQPFSLHITLVFPKPLDYTNSRSGRVQKDCSASPSSIGLSYDFPIIVLTSGGAEEPPMDHSQQSVVRKFQIFQINNDSFMAPIRFRY